MTKITMSEYRRLQRECKLLGLSCVGPTDVLRERLRAAKAIETPEETISPLSSLPGEILTNEVLFRLPIDDLLSFCQSERQGVALCRDLLLWQRYFDRLTYLERQTTIKQWGWSGSLLDQMLELIESRSLLFDRRSLETIYLYLLELVDITPRGNVVANRYTKTLEKLKEIVRMISPNINTLAVYVDLTAFQKMRKLLTALKAEELPDDLSTIVKDLIIAYNNASIALSEKYIGDLLTSALSKAQIDRLFDQVLLNKPDSSTSIAIIICQSLARARNTQLFEFLAANNNRENKKIYNNNMVERLIHHSLSYYTQDESVNLLRLYRLDIGMASYYTQSYIEYPFGNEQRYNLPWSTIVDTYRSSLRTRYAVSFGLLSSMITNAVETIDPLTLSDKLRELFGNFSNDDMVRASWKGSKEDFVEYSLRAIRLVLRQDLIYKGYDAWIAIMEKEKE